jgi:hypothetical protein
LKAVCPDCGKEFEAKRNAYGAKYARDWTELPEWHVKFLAWWLSALPRNKLRKEDMKSGFKYVDMDAINARISELKAWRLVLPEKDAYYSLNIELVVLVLNNGGRLDVLRAREAQAHA